MRTLLWGVACIHREILQPQEEALAMSHGAWQDKNKSGVGEAESKLLEPGPASGDKRQLGQGHHLAYLSGLPLTLL